ncbi:hypothetical protein NECAME_17198 [Necator americanus]|uniref:Uncharacterized protein n=1 Tax=Necator americanus TaxID=51031 RepID=W2TR33_NECAM|nr:hypothetical protein NECAME_17198 [Necator americanus]ETN84243.1 hypothetical protein NECAME_17198 [Necator americanus]
MANDEGMRSIGLSEVDQCVTFMNSFVVHPRTLPCRGKHWEWRGERPSARHRFQRMKGKMNMD